MAKKSKKTKKKKGGKGDKESRQAVWLVGFLILILLIIIFVPIIKHEIFGKFEYIKLDFEKTKLGEIPFYSTKIPLTDTQGKVTGVYPLNLRTDPRTLENISVDVDEFSFNRNDKVYISLEKDLPKCEDTSIALGGLSNFLKNFGNMKIKGAQMDKDYANASEQLYVTCETHPNNTVILVKHENSTYIRKEGRCYEVAYKDCEVLRVSEKFIIEVLRGYMNYFVKK